MNEGTKAEDGLSTLETWEQATAQKLSKKELGKQQHGHPDDWDYTNIKSLIDSYDKAHPGRLAKMSTDYAVEKSFSSRDKYGTVSKQSDMRFTMWMPVDLQQVLEKGYPSIWTNKQHLAWFLKRFPFFKAAEKH